MENTDYHGGSLDVMPKPPYGSQWSSQYFVCWSRFTDVQCKSLYSRHGFKINRDGVNDFIWTTRELTPPVSYVGSGGGTGNGGGSGGGGTDDDGGSGGT